MECHALPPAAYVRPPPATPRELAIAAARQEVASFRQHAAELKLAIVLTRAGDPNLDHLRDHLEAVRCRLAGAVDQFRRIAGDLPVVARRPRPHVQAER